MNTWPTANAHLRTFPLPEVLVNHWTNSESARIETLTLADTSPVTSTGTAPGMSSLEKHKFPYLETCHDYGTYEKLVFGGIDVDEFEITVTARVVQVRVGMGMEVDVGLEYRKFVKPSQELEILEVPVSGWDVPASLNLCFASCWILGM
ncbi:hypothetical protein BDW69DRAFT_182248 [Aspergillus filifer]